MDPMTVEPTVPELVDTWQAALDDLVDLVDPLTDEQWRRATPCPGWSVGDVVAHTVDIESVFSGAPRPEHTPEWDRLPHAASPFGQFTETGVDYRRATAKADVSAELRAIILTRRAQIDAVPVGGEVMGFSGSMVPLSRFVRTRTFDVWAHEQDVRAAVGRDRHWSSAPAIVSFQQMAGALPYVWGKEVQAPEGAVVRISVTGPELESELYAVVDDGKGRACSAVDDADVHLTLSWPDYMRLSCGRLDVDDPGLRGRLSLNGDSDLGEALLRAMAITP